MTVESLAFAAVSDMTLMSPSRSRSALVCLSNQSVERSADGSAIALHERNIGDIVKCGFRHSTRIQGRSLDESLPMVGTLLEQSNVETTGRGIPSA